MNVYIGGLVCSTPFGLTPISLTPEVRNAHPVENVETIVF